MHAFIGSSAESASDSFNFVLTTPKALTRLVAERGVVFGERYFVIGRYDYQLVEAEIKRICASITGKSWPEAALRLDRFFGWEYVYTLLPKG